MKAKTKVASKSPAKQPAGVAKVPTHTNTNQVFMELKRAGVVNYFEAAARLLEASGIEGMVVPYGNTNTTIYPYPEVKAWMDTVIAEHRAKQASKAPQHASPAGSPITSGLDGGLRAQLDAQNRHIEQIQQAMTTVLTLVGRTLDKMQSIEVALTNIDADVLDGAAKVSDALEAGFTTLRGEIEPMITDILEAMTQPAPVRPATPVASHDEASVTINELDAALSQHDDDPTHEGR